VPERSTSEVEVAIGKLKMYKSPGYDQIQAGKETLLTEIHNLLS
jgi:hypothetical protein